MTSHSHPHEMKVYGEIKLFAGSGSPELSGKISKYLNSPLCERELRPERQVRSCRDAAEGEPGLENVASRLLFWFLHRNSL